MELLLIAAGAGCFFWVGFFLGRVTAPYGIDSVPDDMRLCANCRWSALGVTYCSLDGDDWRPIPGGVTSESCARFSMRRTGMLIRARHAPD